MLILANLRARIWEEKNKEEAISPQSTAVHRLCVCRVFFLFFSKETSAVLCCAVLCWVSQSYLILCDPVDCSLPGSSVHGILQARILEWVAMPSSRGSSQPRDRTCVSYCSCTDFTTSTIWEACLYIWEGSVFLYEKRRKAHENGKKYILGEVEREPRE